MRRNHVQGSFNAGEFSPKMLGRTDLQDYQNAAQSILNWLIRPQGGLTARSGTRYVREVEDSAVKGRLVPFIYSTEQAYVLEFCDLKIRFYMDEGIVLESAKTITDVTKANPAVVTSAGHGYNNGDEVYIEDVGGMTEINDRYFIVAGVAANTFQLSGEDSTGYGAYTSGGTAKRIYEKVTTYTEAELPDLSFAQSIDQLFIAHGDHAPAVLSRTGHTAWTLADWEFIDGPYLGMRIPEVGEDRKPDTLLINPAGVTGDIALNAADDIWEDPRDVGRMIRLAPGAGVTAWGAARIYQVDSATVAQATVTAGDEVDDPDQLPDAGATKYWHLGAYYSGNYPKTVSFFEGRLCFGSTPLEPERFDASVISSWDDFGPTKRADDVGGGPPIVADDSALEYQIGGSRSDVNVIRWLICIHNLIIGTTAGIRPVQGASRDSAVSPSSIKISSSDAHGSSDVQAVSVSDAAVYISRSGKKVYAAGYSWQSDAYRSEDLTLLAEHVTESGIADLAYQMEPYSILWAARTDGKLIALTYERPQNVFAWSRHQIGGSFGSGNAVVESIAVIPSPDGDHDQLWMIVKRTINGSTVRYVEFMEEEFPEDGELEDAFFVDCGSTYDSTPTTTITGLDYLEGETVKVLADGATHPDCTVSSGSITLQREASVVQVGLEYVSDLETLPLVYADALGTTQARTKRPTHALLCLHRSLGLEIGPDVNSLSRIPFRSTSDPMDAPPPLFTGVKEIQLSHGYSLDPVLYVRRPDPHPCTILWVGTREVVSE